MNEYGNSPLAEGTFTTPDSGTYMCDCECADKCVSVTYVQPCVGLMLLFPCPVPIIGSVEVAVLSLFEVEVNISLLTNGGKSVTRCT